MKNKKPDSGESGLAVVSGGFFQPRRMISAHSHRRQAHPCQRADLIVVILTAVDAMDLRAKFTARFDDETDSAAQADFFARDISGRISG